jgi:hypothetical protein
VLGCCGIKAHGAEILRGDVKVKPKVELPESLGDRSRSGIGGGCKGFVG